MAIKMPTKANSTAWATRGYGLADVALDSRVTHGLGDATFFETLLVCEMGSYGIIIY